MRVCSIIGICLATGAGLLAAPSEAGAATPVFTVSATIRNVGSAPIAIAVDPSRHAAYVVSVGKRSVTVRDTVSHARIATVPVNQDGLNALAIDTNTHTVWVVNQFFGAATVIDENTNKVVDTIQIATSQGEQPTAIAIDPGRHRAYVSNLNHTTAVLDTLHRRVLTTWPNIGSGGVAVDRQRNVVLVEDQSGGTVIFVAASTGAVLATVPVADWPSYIAIDPHLDRAYVTSFTANKLSMLDLSTRTVLRAMPIHHAPAGVAVDPTTGTVYVSNHNQDTESMYQATNLAPLGTVTIGAGATEGAVDVAVDPTSHRAYALSEFDNSISVIDRTVAQSLRATT